MSALAEWNSLPEVDALRPVLACCGSRAFARSVCRNRPYWKVDSLVAQADAIWWSLAERDWLEAFACHPRIGESGREASDQFSAWSAQEQAKARSAPESILDSIATKNRLYEARHGFIYIVCANGRSAEDLLGLLERRLDNSTDVELHEAAEQQRQITHLRIRKWLAE